MFSAFVRSILTPVCLLITLASFSQQPPTPRTLLWRITGKDLQQPSYLYGTMHLQDKRLFQFGDSVYAAIEKTQGLATEIDFQQAFDTLFKTRDAEKATDKLLAKEKVKFNRSKLDPSALKLLQKFGITGSLISKKQLKDIQEYRTQSLVSGGEMPTIVDGYLLGLAQRQAKWTGGIEDVSDQLSLTDEMGGELKPEAVLQPEKAYRQAIENMVKIYVAQDLDKIDEWSNGEFGGQFRDAILMKRNIKMAYRMDSLSAVRPMFFAVGAAHLPGDSGVIQLLRNRGFRVEPVFSARQLPADDYASHLGQKEWEVIKGTDAAYTVQMPGVASDVNESGESVKMFFDLTTMTIYMTRHFTGYDAKNRPLDVVLRDAAKNIGGTGQMTAPVPVVHNGLQGKETFTNRDGYSFRIQLFSKDKTLFMLMAGSPKKEMIAGSDANRFFKSFVPGETAAPKVWERFSLPGAAFSVRVPGTPEPQKEVDAKIAGNPSWAYTTYYSIDPQTQFFYLVQLRQVKAGYNIENDSSYLLAMGEDYKSRLDTVTGYRIAPYNGYPASYLEYEVKEVSGVYKSLHVIRGNQVYVLMGGAPKGSDMTDIDSFLHSLVLLPYDAVEWKKWEAPGFSSLAPAPFIKTVPDSTAANGQFFTEYSAYNEKDAVSYAVQKTVLSQNFWAASDSVFLEEKLALYKGDADSLLEKSWVKTGSINGVDVLIKPNGHSGLKKIRLLVNKDTLYTIYSVVQASEWNKDRHQQFFTEFRLQNEVAPTIYTSKAAPLLEALTTTDSTEFENALADFESVAFSKEDLPLLHKALLKDYRDSDGYYSAHTKVLDRIVPVADKTTLQFVGETYPTLGGSNEEKKYRLLQLLAGIKTSESYALLKQLLLSTLPKEGNAISLQSSLLDSLTLTATLFPELLQKADDSLLSPVIASVAGRLLDSSLLTVPALKPYIQTVLRGAAQELQILQQGDYEPWELIRWTHLLSWLNEQEGNALLQTMLRQQDVYLKKAVILALLKNNGTVPSAEIEKVAADRNLRLYFFDALRQMGKESLFPPVYATQKSLAESELYDLLTEDYEDVTLTYIGQRTIRHEGATRLFHLFKVGMAIEEDDVKRDYLGVAGPYPLSAKEKVLYGDATGFYAEERFHPQKTDKLLKAYLLSIKPAEK